MQMANTWTGWCRICARKDVDVEENNSTVQDTSHLFESLNKYLRTQIAPEDKFKKYVCTPCEQQIQRTISFIERTLVVQVMFTELAHTSDDVNVNEIRLSFLGSDEEQTLQPFAEPMIDVEEPVTEDVVNPLTIREIVRTSQCENADKSVEVANQKQANSKLPMKNDFLRNGSFYCSKCCISFKYFRDLKSHMQVTHHISLFEPCPICTRVCFTPTDLRLHIAKHFNPHQNTCHHCGETFPAADLLQNHIQKSHKGANEHVCRKCGLRCASPSIYRRHLFTHNGISSTRCRMCRKTIRTKDKFMVSEDKVICGSCMPQEKVSKCSFCGKELRPDGPDHICNRGLRPVWCKFCGRGFESEAVLQAHVNSCRRNKISANRPEPRTTTGRAPAGTEVLNVIKVEETRFGDQLPEEEILS